MATLRSVPLGTSRSGTRDAGMSARRLNLTTVHGRECAGLASTALIRAPIGCLPPHPGDKAERSPDNVLLEIADAGVRVREI